MLRGNATYEHHFTGPGQQDVWAVAFVAVLESPDGSSQSGGTFSLAVEMTVRTEGGEELAE